MDGHIEAHHKAIDLAYYAAWHSGLFSQTYQPGKFPPFNKHAPKRRDNKVEKPKASAEQIEAGFKAFVLAFGGTIN